jgi:hypothetical protein
MVAGHKTKSKSTTTSDIIVQPTLTVVGYIPARLVQVECHLTKDDVRTMSTSSTKKAPRSAITLYPESFRLRLVERDEILADRIGNIEYIALSHCWGCDQAAIPRTTKQNRSARKEGIPWNELTKTFKDAMEITWKLQKQYIWIDSLCIVQDDSSDLEVHCASMSQVYSNAVCTIAATGAVDGTQGCFMERNSNPQHPCVIKPVYTPPLNFQVSF